MNYNFHIGAKFQWLARAKAICTAEVVGVEDEKVTIKLPSQDMIHIYNNPNDLIKDLETVNAIQIQED